MTFLARALKLSLRVFHVIEALELVALVSLVAQAKDVDLCSSAVCGEEGTACACARIAST